MQQASLKAERAERDYYIRLIKTSKSLAEARHTHAILQQSAFYSSRYLKNLLIEMYGKCGGGMEYAESVFETMRSRNVFTWTLMFMAYAQNGHLYKAKGVFDTMPTKDLVAWTAMISAYAGCGKLNEAKSVFDQMPVKDPKAWNTLITAYANSGHLQKAREFFENASMQQNLDVITWTSMIWCYLQHGNMLGARQLFNKMPNKDTIVFTMMVVAYAENGDVKEAKRLFDLMPERDIAACNALLTAYAQNRHLPEAKAFFDAMSERDEISWNALMAAYAQNGHLQEAIQVFNSMTRPGVVSCNTMISAYAQHGHIEQAKYMFDNMRLHKNLVTWNALLTGYSENRLFIQVINFFQQIHLNGVKPDEVSFITALDACASLTESVQGRILHAQVLECGISTRVKVANALVDMYAKCGSLTQARSIFNEMKKRDSISWSSIISAYARTGHMRQARHMFNQMNLEGFEPNEVVFICILTACCHAGLLHEAWHYFVSITGDHATVAWVEHYGCIVDLLSRSGRVQDAEDLLNSMPYEPDLVAWKSLLSACNRQREFHATGTHAAKEILKLNVHDSASYVIVSNQVGSS